MYLTEDKLWLHTCIIVVCLGNDLSPVGCWVGLPLLYLFVLKVSCFSLALQIPPPSNWDCDLDKDFVCLFLNHTVNDIITMHKVSAFSGL